MHAFSRSLARAVKNARDKMNLTQEQVGELVDTNTRTISWDIVQMNFHIIREYNDSVQIQVDDLFHLWQGAILLRMGNPIQE